MSAELRPVVPYGMDSWDLTVRRVPVIVTFHMHDDEDNPATLGSIYVGNVDVTEILDQCFIDATCDMLADEIREVWREDADEAAISNFCSRTGRDEFA